MAKRINCIDDYNTFLLNETNRLYDPRIKLHYEALVIDKWQFVAVDQQRGFCRYNSKMIAIPLYAIKRGIACTTYYMAHEMAHAFAGWKASHGPLFMQKLVAICPTEFQHFEYEYKPREAMRAGVAITKEMLF